MIYELAGVAGVNPDPFRLYELIAMAESRNKSDWWHTASIMCLLANINRGKGKRPFTPNDFFPFGKTKKNKISLTKDTISALKVFVDGVHETN